jgi:hypothetical protein
MADMANSLYLPFEGLTHLRENPRYSRRRDTSPNLDRSVVHRSHRSTQSALPASLLPGVNYFCAPTTIRLVQGCLSNHRRRRGVGSVLGIPRAWGRGGAGERGCFPQEIRSLSTAFPQSSGLSL